MLYYMVSAPSCLSGRPPIPGIDSGFLISGLLTESFNDPICFLVWCLCAYPIQYCLMLVVSVLHYDCYLLRSLRFCRLPYEPNPWAMSVIAIHTILVVLLHAGMLQFHIANPTIAYHTNPCDIRSIRVYTACHTGDVYLLI